MLFWEDVDRWEWPSLNLKYPKELALKMRKEILTDLTDYSLRILSKELQQHIDMLITFLAIVIWVTLRMIILVSFQLLPMPSKKIERLCKSQYISKHISTRVIRNDSAYSIYEQGRMNIECLGVFLSSDVILDGHTLESSFPNIHGDCRYEFYNWQRVSFAVDDLFISILVIHSVQTQALASKAPCFLLHLYLVNAIH